MILNLHSLAYPVTSLGPGQRVVLWTAGCSRGCPGCLSPEMQPPDSGRRIETTDLTRRLDRLDRGIDGLTITGGEPVEQTEALISLLQQLTGTGRTWNVLVYSGYTLEEIKSQPPGRRLLALVDILIDGPFRVELPSMHPLVGSGNQKIHYLSARGRSLKKVMNLQPVNRFNLGLGPDGSAILIGVNEPESRRAAHEALGLGSRPRPES